MYGNLTAPAFISNNYLQIGNTQLNETNLKKVLAVPTTPSGDPLHYYYTYCGAVYNTKTGYWEINGLTDMTNQDMMDAYMRMRDVLFLPITTNRYFNSTPARTNLNSTGSYDMSDWFKNSTKSWEDMFDFNQKLEVLAISTNTKYMVKTNSLGNTFYDCRKLRKIIGLIDITNVSPSNTTFYNCGELQDVTFYGLSANINFQWSSKLTMYSLAYLINNAVTTKDITITLHNTVYQKAITDATITAALASHPRVSIVLPEA